MEGTRTAAVRGITRQRLTVLLLLTPALVVVLLLFTGGLALGIIQSFGYLPAAGLTTFTLDAYRKIFAMPGFVRSAAFTLFVSVCTTMLSVVFGIGTAFALRGRTGRAATFVYQIPLTVPHLVVAVAVMMLVSQSGLTSRVLFQLGLIGEPADFPALLYDPYGVGIILVYVWKQIPFIGLITLSVLQSVGENYEGLSRTLGASRWQTVRHVLIPLLLPAIVPGSIIIFAFVFGSFEVPLLLGKSYPSMLSVLAYRLYIDVDLTMRPEAMATSVLIALFVLALTVLYRFAADLLQRRRL